MLSRISHAMWRFKSRVYQYFHKRYLWHYYASAIRPRPIRFILLMITGGVLFFTLAIAGTVVIFNGEFQGSSVKAFGLIAFMYLCGFAEILTVIPLIQGYRHRDRIRKALNKILDLPKSSGSGAWQILLIVGIIIVGLVIAIQAYFNW